MYRTHPHVTPLIAALAVFAAAPVAFAHRYVPNDGTHTSADTALVISDYGVSQVVYNEATEAAPGLWLTFEGRKGDTLFVQLGVPVIDGLENYRPTVAVMGPGLSGNSAPVPIPNGLGAAAFPSDTVEPVFFDEKFTGTQSWILLEEKLTLPADGRYYIATVDPNRQAGKFWVAVGTKEEFGLGDILTYGDVLDAVRTFHEVADQPLPLLPCVMLLVSRLLSNLLFFLPG